MKEGCNFVEFYRRIMKILWGFVARWDVFKRQCWFWIYGTSVGSFVACSQFDLIFVVQMVHLILDQRKFPDTNHKMRLKEEFNNYIHNIWRTDMHTDTRHDTDIEMSAPLIIWENSLRVLCHNETVLWIPLDEVHRMYRNKKVNKRWKWERNGK